MTLFAGSPCAKTVSFPRNMPTFLPKPAESRNNCTSKTGLPKFAFLGERGALTDTRRTASDTMHQKSMDTHLAGCAILNTPCRFAQGSCPDAELQQVLRIQWITSDR